MLFVLMILLLNIPTHAMTDPHEYFIDIEDLRHNRAAREEFIRGLGDIESSTIRVGKKAYEYHEVLTNLYGGGSESNLHIYRLLLAGGYHSRIQSDVGFENITFIRTDATVETEVLFIELSSKINIQIKDSFFPASSVCKLYFTPTGR